MYTYSLRKHVLKFINPAKTSRNVFTERAIYLITLVDVSAGKQGVGEAAPLSLLSIDDVSDYEAILHNKLQEFCEARKLEDVDLAIFPSVRFGIETALRSLTADDQGRMYDTPFTRGEEQIPVNGLVWMNDAETMYQEAIAKINAGFNVIKFKVGALDFDDECRLLEKIRRDYSAFRITLRVDANGAFKPDEAMEQLCELSKFELHSIEQPIATNQWDDMARLCAESPIDIALDEELIGVNVYNQGAKLLDYIKPHYLILKPNLIGGVSIADKWITQARKVDVDWWATSALESNVGLNAIAQWVSTYDATLHQGLGTGGLFTNNLDTRLLLQKGVMSYAEPSK
ncbi:MAG: o-succinylbenzoate synthase [Bacteroidetes bacterium]|jgi:o-succinylbenzoate synthase|nr:o-succinylbenzoate synthase [Bacteroidota bacterium]